MVQTYFKGIYIHTCPPKKLFPEIMFMDYQFVNLFQENIYKLKTPSDDGQASECNKFIVALSFEKFTLPP